jgi:HEPN domain-containing protein
MKDIEKALEFLARAKDLLENARANTPEGHALYTVMEAEIAVGKAIQNCRMVAVRSGLSLLRIKSILEEE